MNAKRLTLMQAGKPKRKVILTAPPYPEIGEFVEIKGAGSWIVVRVEDTTVLLTIPLGKERA